MKQKYRHWNTRLNEGRKQDCLCNKLTEDKDDTKGLCLEKDCELIGEVEVHYRDIITDEEPIIYLNN